MHCTEARLHLLDHERGRLPLDTERAVQSHLDACPACTRAATAERALTELLDRELPQHPASLALKRRLAAQWPATEPRRRLSWRRWAWSLGPALAAAVLLVVGVPFLSGERAARRDRDATAAMVAEAVNDHLRMLDRPRPLDVESGGIHQVKPWFTGRLDFAPVVAFAGDEQFPLKGGSIGYFVDRRAAVFVYGRRLHSITLFVFRAGGLPWPTYGLRPLGSIAVYATAARGFNVILWEQGDLGYALVSDLDSTELLQLARLISGGP